MSKKLAMKKEVRDLSRPTMSLVPEAKPFKRSILQEQFIKYKTEGLNV